MDALIKLNQACREVGVCDSEAILMAPEIKHAAELFKEGSPRKILMCCWQDGAVTSCVIETGSGEKQCCYTAEDGGDELYFAWQAHLSSPEVGYKVKSVEVERKEVPLVRKCDFRWSGRQLHLS